MNEIYKDFIDFCSEEDISDFAESRKFPIDLLKTYRIGRCTSEVISKLKAKHSLDNLELFGFISKKKFTYFNRIIFPYTLDYFSARNPDKTSEPKYKNLFPKGLPKQPYYLPGLKLEDAYIVEGETDALRLKQHYDSAHIFAITGTLSFGVIETIRKKIVDLKPSRVIIAYDNDAPGEKALQKTIQIFSELEGWDISTFKLIFPGKYKDIDDYFTSQNKKEDLKLEELRINPIDKNSIYSDNIELKSLSQMLKDGIPEIKYNVENIIPQNSLIYFGGGSGEGKTWVAMQLALSVAAGKPFLDNFETLQGSVIYFDEENGTITLLNRFGRLRLGHYGLDQEFNNLYLSIFENIKLDTEPGKPNKIEPLIKRYNPRLIIIDSLVRCFTGEEDKSKDVSKIFDNLKKIMQQYPELSIIILHHLTKGNKKNMDSLRGSGDIAAMADCVYMFCKNNDFINAKCVKHRYLGSDESEDFTALIETTIAPNLKLKYVEPSEAVGNPINTIITDMLDWFENEGIETFRTEKAAQTMAKQGHSKFSFYKALKKMLKEKDIRKLKRGHYEVMKPFLSSKIKQEELQTN